MPDPERNRPQVFRLTSQEEREPLHAAYAEARRRGEEIGHLCPDDSIIQYAIIAYDQEKYGTQTLALPDWLVDLIHAATTAAQQGTCAPADQHDKGCARCSWRDLYQAVPERTRTLTEQTLGRRVLDARPPAPDVVIPAGRDLISVLLDRIGNHTYEGGVNGTCYQCPFASVPLQPNGREANWEEISNDPTEAYYRCYLPGRPNDVEWGEYAPCDEKEWVSVLRAELDTLLPPDIEALIEASSLGTPTAKALRASVPVEVARRIVARSKETP